MSAPDGSVYFIRLGKYLKVGLSANPERRCKNLFSSSTAYAAPWDCSKARADRTLIGYVDGDSRHEHDAHRALQMFSVGCEFFLAEPLSLDYIARSLAAGRVLRTPVVRPEGQAPRAPQSELVNPADEAAAWAQFDANFTRMVRGGAA